MGTGAHRVVLYDSVQGAIAAGEPDGGQAGQALPHRLDWLATVAEPGSWWLSVRDPEQRHVRGVATFVSPTRALPGHRLVRIDHLRFARGAGTAEAAAAFLQRTAREDRTVLGVTIDTVFADEVERDDASAALTGLGYQPSRRPRMYTHTVRIDVTPAPDRLLAGMHATARRHIRAIAKRPVELRPVETPESAARLEAITRETFGRTAGDAVRERWAPLIDYCRIHPEQARLVALHRTDRDGPEAIVAFALGLNHGDHVEYSTAGSTRPADLRMPFGYALAWDLICWTRSVGAGWFDFGGIVPHPDADDPLTGIYEFKRMFGGDVVEVRREWSYVSRPVREAWVRGVGRLARSVRRRV